MPRISPLPREHLGDLEDALKSYEDFFGYVPNSVLTMARKPAMMLAFQNLSKVVYQSPGKIGSILKVMVGYMASRSAGCKYCQAHAANGIRRGGASQQKLAAIWQYETSDLFTDAERAALRVAQLAAQIPNAVMPEDLADLKKHFSPEEIIEIVAMIAHFGWLNRWNDSLATELEPLPLKFAEQNLEPDGWQVGVHRP